MNAIHLGCEREGGGGSSKLTFDKMSGTYRSGSWNISPEEAESLVGGWVYLHEAKDIVSQFDGTVVAFEVAGHDKAAGRDSVMLVVAPSRDGRGQKWRGKRNEPVWSGGVIEASLIHEQAQRSQLIER